MIIPATILFILSIVALSNPDIQPGLPTAISIIWPITELMSITAAIICFIPPKASQPQNGQQYQPSYQPYQQQYDQQYPQQTYRYQQPGTSQNTTAEKHTGLNGALHLNRKAKKPAFVLALTGGILNTVIAVWMIAGWAIYGQTLSNKGFSPSLISTAFVIIRVIIVLCILTFIGACVCCTNRHAGGGLLIFSSLLVLMFIGYMLITNYANSLQTRFSGAMPTLVALFIAHLSQFLEAECASHALPESNIPISPTINHDMEISPVGSPTCNLPGNRSISRRNTGSSPNPQFNNSMGNNPINNRTGKLIHLSRQNQNKRNRCRIRRSNILGNKK